MDRSRIPGFYRLDPASRLEELRSRFELDEDELSILAGGAGLDLRRADKMVENCVGVLGLPIGLGLNFRVNARDYAVPMVIEEPSVPLRTVARTLPAASRTLVVVMPRRRLPINRLTPS